MTFGDAYIQHMNCLQNVGMLGIEPVEHKGMMITPIEFLTTFTRSPASLGPRTVGKLILDVLSKVSKMENKKSLHLQCLLDHQECYKETGAQSSFLYNGSSSNDWF